jgi:hypothetical protein
MTDCTNGSYCNKEILAAVSGTCDAGYYCRTGTITYTKDSKTITEKTGAKSKRPLAELRIPELREVDADGYAKVEGDICPRGHYCGAGDHTPNKCAAGKYLPYRGASLIGECQDCWPGYLCPNQGMPIPVTLCPPGFFCPLGRSDASSAS